MLDSIKEGYQFLKEKIAEAVLIAEKIANLSGEDKKAYVVKWVDEQVKLPSFWDNIVNIDGMIIGIIVDRLIGALNCLGGGVVPVDIKPAIAAQVMEASHKALAAVASQTELTLDQKIDALFKEYGIMKEPAPEKATPNADVTPATPTPVESHDKNWERSFDLVLQSEGGYVDHPADKGGPTNLGITQGTLATAIAKGIVPHVDIKDLTKEQASLIYRKMYWAPASCDEVHWAVCYMLYDTTVNGGMGMTARVFQEALNATFDSKLDVDGKWGPKTRGEIIAHFSIDKPIAYVGTFGTNYIAARKAYYDRIIQRNPSQKVFRNGWYNRLRDVAKSCDIALPESLEV